MRDTNARVEDLVYFLLMGALEESLEVINQFLPPVVRDFAAQKWPLEGGLSKFVQALSDNLSDFPHSPEWFFECVLKPLMDAKRVDFRKMSWLQDEDEIYSVGGHILLFAQLWKCKNGQVEELQEPMKVLKSKIEEAGEDMDELRDRVKELTGLCEKDG